MRGTERGGTTLTHETERGRLLCLGLGGKTTLMRGTGKGDDLYVWDWEGVDPYAWDWEGGRPLWVKQGGRTTFYALLLCGNPLYTSCRGTLCFKCYCLLSVSNVTVLNITVFYVTAGVTADVTQSPAAQRSRGPHYLR